MDFTKPVDVFGFWIMFSIGGFAQGWSYIYTGCTLFLLYLLCYSIFEKVFVSFRIENMCLFARFI